MTKPTQLSISSDLLNELLCAQYEIIENYKAAYGDYIRFGKWNIEINMLVNVYNESAEILGLEKLETVEHD